MYTANALLGLMPCFVDCIFEMVKHLICFRGKTSLGQLIYWMTKGLHLAILERRLIMLLMSSLLGDSFQLIKREKLVIR